MTKFGESSSRPCYRLNDFAILAGLGPGLSGHGSWMMHRQESRLLHSLAILAEHEISESRVISNHTRNCTFGCSGIGGSKGKALYTSRQSKGPGHLESGSLGKDRNIETLRTSETESPNNTCLSRPTRSGLCTARGIYPSIVTQSRQSI
jgi:hypothetical protein